MPSNAMTISQLIEQLSGLQADHGDLDVIFAVPVDNTLIAVDGRNVSVDREVLGKTLAQPAVIIGLWRDQAGKLRNSPGSVYAGVADDGGWNRSRASAPENTEVQIWKRYKGFDIGYRIGDRWFVFEGAAERPVKPIEIIPGGILGWRPL